MKKFIPFIIALVISVLIMATFAACGPKEKEGELTTPEPTSEVAPTDEVEEGGEEEVPDEGGEEVPPEENPGETVEG